MGKEQEDTRGVDSEGRVDEEEGRRGECRVAGEKKRRRSSEKEVQEEHS